MRRLLVCLLVLLGLALIADLPATGPPAEMSSMQTMVNFDRASATTPALDTLTALLGDCATSAPRVDGLATVERRHNGSGHAREVVAILAHRAAGPSPRTMNAIYNGHELQSDRNLRRLGPAQAATAIVLRI